VQYQYNAQGNLLKEIDPAGRVKTYTYAANGVDLIGVHQKTGSSSVALLEASYTNHLPTTVTDASGRDTVVTYNSAGQPQTVTNALNETVTYDYSTTGLLRRITGNNPASYTALAYDTADRVTSVTTFPQNYTLRMEYDELDRPTKIYYPDGSFEEQVWDKLDVVASRDRIGQWTKMQYTPGGKLATVTNPEAETIQLDWCGCGGLSRLIDAEGRITAWYRDLAGRVTKKELPDLSAESFSYEAQSGRLKTRTDAMGQKTNYTYNNDNTLAQVSMTNLAAGTHAVPTVSLAWDTNFRRLTGWTDGLGSTALAYVPYAPSNSTYGDGKLASIDGPWTDDVIAYTYDELGRMKQRTINGSANLSAVDYDSDGRVTSATNNLGTFTYDYDPATEQLSKITSSFGHITNFSYKGALEDLRLEAIENLDTTGGLLSKFTYGYDPLSRITEWGQQQDPNEAEPTPFRMRYDRADRLLHAVKEVSNDTGTDWAYRYNRAGNRLNDQVEQFSAAGSSVARKQYGINTADQVTSSVAGGPLHVAGTLAEPGKILQTGAVTYALTDETTPPAFAAWVDAVSSASATVVATDFANQTTSSMVVVNPVGAETRSNVTYDLNGNLKSYVLTAADGVTTALMQFEWDGKNQLIAVQKPGAFRSEFTYDGLGRRVKIVEKDGSGAVTATRWFLWDGLAIAEERQDSSGAPGTPNKRFYSHGEERGSVKYFYTRDHLGSVREVTDSAGQLVASYEYDPYGEVTQTAGSTSFDFLYTGHLYHTSSGQYLAPYRAYDPKAGRWISREPLGLDGPNHYHYGFNSPLNGTDPTGLWFLTDPATYGDGRGYQGYANGWPTWNPWDFYEGFMAAEDAVWGWDGNCEMGLYDPNGLGIPESQTIAAYSGALAFGAYGHSSGAEFNVGRNFRIAPFGSPKGAWYSRLPHYHRTKKCPITGETLPGQGGGRHRPWQKKSPDTSIKDRF